MKELDIYPWSGHGAVMGRVENNWQDNEFMLERFGKNMKQARLSYWRFVEQGISLGRQPQLVGVGLVRPVGGWSEIKALRSIGHFDSGIKRRQPTGSGIRSAARSGI